MTIKIRYMNGTTDTKEITEADYDGLALNIAYPDGGGVSIPIINISTFRIE